MSLLNSDCTHYNLYFSIIHGDYTPLKKSIISFLEKNTKNFAPIHSIFVTLLLLHSLWNINYKVENIFFFMFFALVTMSTIN